MGVRDRLVKMLGGVPGSEAALVSAAPAGGYVAEAAITSATEAAGMSATRPFSPGMPMLPADGYSNTPRSHDFLTGVNIASRPRLNQQVAFPTLRGLVDAYDVAQMCIWHRIDSVRGMDWAVNAKKGIVGDQSAAIDVAVAALSKPDGEFPFEVWLAKFLYDILAFDAGTIFRMRNVAGRAVGLRVLDGTTIAPLLDYWGNRPTGDAPAFVQFAQGIPWEWLTSEDLVYQPFRPQSNSPYGKAPLETILLNANTDLRFQSYFLQRFTEGNLPQGFAMAPENWTPDQIREYQEAWDALLYGDQSQKQQLKWIPGRTAFEWTNERDFTDTFSLFLMRKTAAAYHVVPADLGFTEDVNRSSGETQADVQFRVGDLPLIRHVEEILSRFLQDDLGLPLDFAFDTGKEVEDRLNTAEADQIYIQNGVVSPSEIRERVYGLSEPGGVPVPRYIFGARSGPIPLSALYAVAGPIDAETAAPAPGEGLPHKPFAPVEGVSASKIPDRPALAVVEYPQDNAAPAPVPSITPPQGPPGPAPVAKAETTGITETTGTYGSPMLEESSSMNEQDDAYLDVDIDTMPRVVEVEKAAIDERAAFTRFVRARRRDGRWRDFTFAAVPPREARERNRAGRSAVRKDAGGPPSVAGLVLRAADTGRVLMLQRALEPPAGGQE